MLEPRSTVACVAVDADRGLVALVVDCSEEVREDVKGKKVGKEV